MSDKPQPVNGGRFETINCIDLFIDEPGDTTVRPLTGAALEHARKERAKIEAALAWHKQHKAKANKPDATPEEGGQQPG